MKEPGKPIRPINTTVHRALTTFRSSDTPPVLPVLQELSPKPEDTIVELGSGEGHFAVPVAGRLAAMPGGGTMIAVDSSRIFTRRLGREAAMRGLEDHLQAVCLDGVPARTLPLASDSADAIFSVNTLQYMADPLPYLKEVARALTPLGTLLIADWQRDVGNGRRTPFFGYTPAELGPLLDTAGLDAHLQISLAGYAWAVRAVKPAVVFA